MKTDFAEAGQMADNSISSNKIMSTRSLWRLGATHASCIWRANKAISVNFSPLSFKDEDAIDATHPHEIDHRSLVISGSTRAFCTKHVLQAG